MRERLTHNLLRTQTSGWTEKTKHLFHPGAIMTITALYNGLAPTPLIEPIELACHYKGEGREFPQPYISEEGVISGYYFNAAPRIREVSGPLRKQFPELADYADELKASPDFQKRIENEDLRLDLIAQLEKRFGPTIEVYPLPAYEKKMHPQPGYKPLSELAKNGRIIIAAGIGETAESDRDNALASIDRTLKIQP